MSDATSKNSGGWQNTLAILAGLVAAWYGYQQADISGGAPLLGALYFGFGGMALVRLGLVIARSAMVAAVYAAICLVAVLAFRGRFMSMTGIDPLAWLQAV